MKRNGTKRIKHHKRMKRTKRITRKHKKHMTRKHMTRKHMTRKHKTRKHKTRRRSVKSGGGWFFNKTPAVIVENLPYLKKNELNKYVEAEKSKIEMSLIRNANEFIPISGLFEYERFLEKDDGGNIDSYPETSNSSKNGFYTLQNYNIQLLSSLCMYIINTVKPEHKILLIKAINTMKDQVFVIIKNMLIKEQELLMTSTEQLSIAEPSTEQLSIAEPRNKKPRNAAELFKHINYIIDPKHKKEEGEYLEYNNMIKEYTDALTEKIKHEKCIDVYCNNMKDFHEVYTKIIISRENKLAEISDAVQSVYTDILQILINAGIVIHNPNWDGGGFLSLSGTPNYYTTTINNSKIIDIIVKWFYNRAKKNMNTIMSKTPNKMIKLLTTMVTTPEKQLSNIIPFFKNFKEIRDILKPIKECNFLENNFTYQHYIDFNNSVYYCVITVGTDNYFIFSKFNKDFDSWVKIVFHIYLKYETANIERIYNNNIDTTNDKEKNLKDRDEQIRDITNKIPSWKKSFKENKEVQKSFNNEGVFIICLNNPTIEKSKMPYNYYPYSSEQDTEISQTGVDYDKGNAANTNYADVNVVAE